MVASAPRLSVKYTKRIPAPGHHRTEHEQRADLAPVEHHHVTRCPHARSSAPVVLRSPGVLGLGHQTAEVAGRAPIAGSLRHRQQSLGRDPALGAGDGLGHQVGDPVVVVADLAGDGPGLGPLWLPRPIASRSSAWSRRCRLRPDKSPPLGRRHACPCVPSLISLRCPLGPVRMLVSTATVTGQGASQVDTSVRGGDFSWPKAGTFVATSGDLRWP